MNRFDEIERLLNKWKGLYQDISRLPNPRLYFYNEITNYGLNSNNNPKVYYELVEHWKQRFQNYPNLQVYESENQKGFLQFHNNHGYNNHIKIYLSLSEQDIGPGVDMIFDYLAQNNIGHLSKVAKKDRSDVIVLRIEREEDVPRVLNFINNNSYLKDKARSISPFTMQSGAAGITFDGYLSYNMTVALIIDNYFASRKESNSFNSICLDDFRRYIDEYSYRTFIDKTNLKNFSKQDEVKNEILRIKKFKPYDNNIEEKTLINYMHIFNAFKTSLNEYANYNDLINDFRNYNKESQESLTINQFSNALNKNTAQDYVEEKILDDYIYHAYNKYNQNKNKIVIAITDFLNNKYNAITRDNFYRAKFKNYLNYDKIMKITNNNIMDYVNQKIEQLHEKTSIYEQAWYATYQKYGNSQTVYAIENSLHGNFASFTNGENKLRDKLIENFDAVDVKRSIETILKTNIYPNTENIGEIVARELETKLIIENNNYKGRKR